ncbi:MAG TPA: hypothetical protein VHM88_12845 [Candidatus Acidoferrales bacterium]|nr:hypothetical protein [Candidatus Acidoferrales bacterium]
MNPLLVYLPVALLFLAALFVWALREKASATARRASSGAPEALAGFELDLPPRALVERIFATQDWEFISRQSSPQIQRAFLEERRGIALSWLRQTRSQAARLLDFHLRIVRRSVNLRPEAEIGLAFRYALFLLESEVLGLLIWLGGPFRSRRTVGYAVRTAQQLSYIRGQLLEAMTGAALGSAHTNLTDGTAAN